MPTPEEISIATLSLLCFFAFIAGLIDSIVGGGGLIQTPAGLVLLPKLDAATVIGSLKIPAFSGTSFASYQYLKKVKIDWILYTIMALTAFVFAYLGSNLLTLVSSDFMKPLLLVILVLLLIYTLIKKDFGQISTKKLTQKQQIQWAIPVCAVIGFYDGFIGPGTGSFFLLAFITFLGMDFLQANANAKIVNLSTNFGSIVLFILKGKIIWIIAVPMAIFNGFGGWVGSKLAIKKGNGFIRKVFLFIVILTLLRFAYDVFDLGKYLEEIHFSKH